METLNVPFIKERIKITHKAFIDSVGSIPDKITADHQLLLARMVARIETILKCFQEGEVIDLIILTNNERSDQSCAAFKLIKKGFEKSIYVWTDGLNISINTVRYPYRSGLNLDDDIIIKNINFETYNWVEFSDKLLHFIHQVIYARMKSIETKIFDK